MLSCLQFCLHFKTGNSLGILIGNSLLSVVVLFCAYTFHFGTLYKCRHRWLLRGKAIWNVAALVFFILALMQILLVDECNAIGYDCCDPHMAHSGCGVIIPHSSGNHRLIDQFVFSRFVGGGAFDPATAYLAFPRNGELHWSSLRLGVHWFAYVSASGLVYRLDTAEVHLHKRAVCSELVAPYLTPALLSHFLGRR